MSKDNIKSTNLLKSDLDKLEIDINNVRLYLIMYKDNYAFWSPIIKWWTNSPYSHCEIYLEYKGQEDKEGLLIGISDDQRVRYKKYNMSKNRHKWDAFEFYPDDTENRAIFFKHLSDFYRETHGCKYDWKGIILSGIFNRKIHSVNKYTCSEWVSIVMDRTLNGSIYYPKWYNIYTPDDVCRTYFNYFKK